MKKSKRLKHQHLQSSAEFSETIDALLTLEALKRRIEAERDLEKQRLDERYSARLGPVLAEMKGLLALAGDYADDHRAELLSDRKAKSFRHGLATVGWRTGNRKVDLRSGITVDHAVNALTAIGLGDYVRMTPSINKDKILDDCKDGRTITVRVVEPISQAEADTAIPLADAGLKITQGEGFYVEPESAAADTLKPAEAAA